MMPERHSPAMAAQVIARNPFEPALACGCGVKDAGYQFKLSGAQF